MDKVKLHRTAAIRASIAGTRHSPVASRSSTWHRAYNTHTHTRPHCVQLFSLSALSVFQAAESNQTRKRTSKNRSEREHFRNQIKYKFGQTKSSELCLRAAPSQRFTRWQCAIVFTITVILAIDKWSPLMTPRRRRQPDHQQLNKELLIENIGCRRSGGLHRCDRATEQI